MNNFMPLKWIRERLAIHLVCFTQALIMLNVSIDPRDHVLTNSPEDLSINDMESIVELALEDLMGIGDCIPETDDNDLEKESGSQRVDVPVWFTFLQDNYTFGALPAKLKRNLVDIGLLLDIPLSVCCPPPELI